MVTIESTPELAAKVYETMARTSSVCAADWAGR